MKRSVIILSAILFVFSTQNDLAGLTRVDTDHSGMISSYGGPSTCIGCHPGKMEEIISTVHYKFESEILDGLLFNADGTPAEEIYSGKFWKLCGFPTAIPQSNWIGQLKNDPETPHVDVPGGCAKCHIGIGMKPYNANGGTEPSEAELANNIDCLYCHATDYTRKYYVSMSADTVDLNPMGAPIVFAAPRVDGVFNFSEFTDAAKTVGGPATSDACLRCHAKAGGGGMAFDGVMHSFKRGEGFSGSTDVHAEAGMTCSTCHYDANHKFKRAPNTDLTAMDSPQSVSGCVNCHTATPHTTTDTYNNHTDKIACQTCHVTSRGGVVYKDFNAPICPSGDCSSESMNLWGLQMNKFPEDFEIDYMWWNGTVEKPIHPLGDINDGKIYPFKKGVFNVPEDAMGNSVPVKWGKYFLTGDMMLAVGAGRSLYSSFLDGFLGNIEEYVLPPLSGEFDHFGEVTDYFSLSHGITTENARTCYDCHAHEGGVIDWVAMGYSENPFVMMSIAEENTTSPETFALRQNYPNPFNPTTTIRYEISKRTMVNFSVYNLTGQCIETLIQSEQAPGVYEVHFDATGYASGLYFYQIVTPEFTETRKMMILQ
ncbi:MAG: T9SS type A sorting domain-containing protein [Candidatus Marinimicrobia bacterium]|nr:T9SS type A sorting domain-containing protein [Candidatus Neomarinimicrobiota bacterium]